MKAVFAKATTLCLALSLLAPAAHAQRVSKVTGTTLGKMCSSDKVTGTSLCDAYLAGIMDSEVWSKKYDTYKDDAGAPVAFCVPTSETAPQIRSKVVSWLHSHNDALTQPAGKAAYRALHDTYACQANAEGMK
ncbi:Rap1a/Tai family immunity protein [Swingsia samuiensis]|uniref:Rap1a immunity protein domain-containing protein n=1 Tax=Swingsia samuiensis TaxID=1293412 RepID=A0A4Y6UJV2_9PROT|nr:Rap1a/Tai family immunity protein [Swingsia samuiensis]QDH17842.1 hypothetical protein E3D00_09875 [Swingsia samuiensis]